MKDALLVSLLSVTPRKRSARTMGWLARRRASRWIVRWFVRAYGVDVSEAEHAIEAYPDLEALFTRALKPGARPIDDRAGLVVSPVDGRAAAIGRTVAGCIEVAPGQQLDVAALLEEPPGSEWDVAVLYLSPKDYHRVHVPLEGAAVAWRYLPGTLWPVFPAAVARVPGLFQKNERVAVRCETAAGPLHVVLVGAFGVGRITLEIASIVTNSGGQAHHEQLVPAVALTRGALLGTFHLGSTVVLASKGGLTWDVEKGDPVRVGASIGHLVKALP